MPTGKAKRNRRVLNFRQQFQPQLSIATLNTFNVLAKTITVGSELPMFGPTEDIEWDLYNATLDEHYIPDSATLDATGIFITLLFATGVLTVGQNYQLTVPSWEPGFRNANGAYLAPTVLFIDP